MAWSPRDRSCRKSSWEGWQEHWPVHISAIFCLLTVTTMTPVPVLGDLQHSAYIAAMRAGFGVPQTWCHSARLSLSFHICTLAPASAGAGCPQSDLAPFRVLRSSLKLPCGPCKAGVVPICQMRRQRSERCLSLSRKS